MTEEKRIAFNTRHGYLEGKKQKFEIINVVNIRNGRTDQMSRVQLKNVSGFGWTEQKDGEVETPVAETPKKRGRKVTA